MRLGRRLVLVSAVTVLLGGPVVATASAASAAGTGFAAGASQGWVRCADLSPGAPFREVTITGPDAADLAASLTLVRAQNAPYQPAQAAIVRLPGGEGVTRGQPALRIDFAAPSPLGLLTGGASA